MSRAEIPEQGHPMCEEDRCSPCLAEHIRLAEYFEQETDCHTEDWLCRYRVWLDATGIPAETEFGWATPEAFDPENVERFLVETGWREPSPDHPNTAATPPAGPDAPRPTHEEPADAHE